VKQFTSKRFKIKEVNISINRVRRMLTSEEVLRKIKENRDKILKDSELKG